MRLTCTTSGIPSPRLHKLNRKMPDSETGQVVYFPGSAGLEKRMPTRVDALTAASKAGGAKTCSRELQVHVI